LHVADARRIAKGPSAGVMPKMCVKQRRRVWGFDANDKDTDDGNDNDGVDTGDGDVAVDGGGGGGGGDDVENAESNSKNLKNATASKGMPFAASKKTTQSNEEKPFATGNKASWPTVGMYRTYIVVVCILQYAPSVLV
jgi:hypothetical protein